MSRIIQWRMKRMKLNIHSHELQTTYINKNDPCTKDKQVHVILKVGENKKELCARRSFPLKRKK